MDQKFSTGLANTPTNVFKLVSYLNSTIVANWMLAVLCGAQKWNFDTLLKCVQTLHIRARICFRRMSRCYCPPLRHHHGSANYSPHCLWLKWVLCDFPSWWWTHALIVTSYRLKLCTVLLFCQNYFNHCYRTCFALTVHLQTYMLQLLTLCRCTYRLMAKESAGSGSAVPLLPLLTTPKTTQSSTHMQHSWPMDMSVHGEIL